MKFQDYIQKHKYLLLIIAVLLIMILGKTNTEWNLLRTVWEILLPFLVGCIMAFILNIPMRFIEKRLFRNKSDSYRVSTRIASFLLTLLIVITIIWLILYSKIADPTTDKYLHFLHHSADIAPAVSLCKKLQRFLCLGK